MSGRAEACLFYFEMSADSLMCRRNASALENPIEPEASLTDAGPERLRHSTQAEKLSCRAPMEAAAGGSAASDRHERESDVLSDHFHTLADSVGKNNLQMAQRGHREKN